jgi:excisionase family DNA binding protein
MQDQVTTIAGGQQLPTAEDVRGRWRATCREVTLQAALHKRAAGVPTYTVPEAAALLSVSQEHLYRLIKADAFPAVHMRRGRDQGRYIVPARAVEAMLDAATGNGGRVDAADFNAPGGAA